MVHPPPKQALRIHHPHSLPHQSTVLLCPESLSFTFHNESSDPHALLASIHIGIVGSQKIKKHSCQTINGPSLMKGTWCGMVPSRQAGI
jgi:hypothetical protein